MLKSTQKLPHLNKSNKQKLQSSTVSTLRSRRSFHAKSTRTTLKLSKNKSPSSVLHKNQRHLSSSISQTTQSSPSPLSPSNPIVVLGIETSCDDTGIAIVNSNREVIQHSLLSQLSLHQLHGGVVPTLAMRAHALTINHLVSKTLINGQAVSIPHSNLQEALFLNQSDSSINPTHQSQLTYLPNTPKSARHLNNHYLASTPENINWLEQELHKMDQFRSHTFLRGRSETPSPTTAPASFITLDLDAISFTLGPGLSGSLAVGVDTAKALGRFFNLPIVPINHIIAHTTVSQLQSDKIQYPYLGLVVSGGHSQVNWVESEQNVTVLGSCVDDAVGEAFDKIYRTMNLEQFDVDQVQKVVINEQHQVKHILNALMMKIGIQKNEDCNELRDAVYNANNELLIDAFEQIIQESTLSHQDQHQHQQNVQSGSKTNNSTHNLTSTLDARSIEHISMEFLDRIQLIQDKPVHKVQMEHVGCVHDLFNHQTTPTAIHQTFQEAQRLLERNNQTNVDNSTPPLHPSTQNESASTSHITTSSSLHSTPSSPSSSTSSTETNPSINVTPIAEREILEKLSNTKNIPHGAQIEVAAAIYYDIVNVLNSYDFMITKMLNQTTPHLEQHRENLKTFFPQESNRNFGMARKASSFTIGHRFLPLLPLPLPLFATSDTQSYIGFSMAGLKTKVRQHCTTEMGLMQSVRDLVSKSDQSKNVNDKTTSSSNPYNRTTVENESQIPQHLNFLKNSPISTTSQISSVSNVFRMLVSSQFQTTTTQHFIQGLTRTLNYLNFSIPGQDAIYLSSRPQSLQLYSNQYDNDESNLTIGFRQTQNSTETKTPKHWHKHTSSVLPTDRSLDIVIGGGVACNQAITKNIQHYFNNFTFSPPKIVKPSTSNNFNGEDVKKSVEKATNEVGESPKTPTFQVHAVLPKHCGDNGVMIAWSGVKKMESYLSQLQQQQQQQPTDQSSKQTTSSSQLESISTQNYFQNENTFMTSHVIDAKIVHEQQMIMDSEFQRLVDQTTTQEERQRLTTPTGAESFCVLYQRPKWPLPEVFVNKPVKPVKIKKE